MPRGRSDSRRRRRSDSRRRDRKDRSRSRRRRSPSRRRRDDDRRRGGNDDRFRRSPPGGVSRKEWSRPNAKPQVQFDPNAERWRCYRCPAAYNVIGVHLKCSVCGLAGPGAKKEPLMTPASVPAADASKTAALQQLASAAGGPAAGSGPPA
eukprot:TRINITY_DN11997_c0_g1_i1.p2 TRINITY_DN11997_c0_g1~~TRINITY_DN11997_c0_g1_i1.p2  ORF type:complete len:151 (+),score=24.60 TRINITY_DN11997_c0_g1_i1:70-522(+)